MKFIFLLFLFYVISLNSYANEYNCVENYLDKKIIFAFNDGDVHQVSFYKNEFDVVTARYSEYKGNEVYSQVKVYCLEYSDQIMLFKQKNDRGVPYKFPVHIELPIDIVTGESRAKVDLRWGRFYDPMPTIFLE